MSQDIVVSQKAKCEQLASLHQGNTAFVIPNPWDIGSAKVLQGQGFKALATTSAGLAFTLGKSDGNITLEDKLRHCAALAANTHIPINVDFENGFDESPEGIVRNLARLLETGVAGCSIEDFSRDGQTLYDPELAKERVQAVAEYVAGLDIPFQLTARAENLLRGVQDLDDTIRRLQAFEAAGADVLYAPGLKTLDELKLVTCALSKPFNVLAPPFSNISLADFQQAGAIRVSVGGALTWLSLGPVLAAGENMLDGNFSWTDNKSCASKVRKLLA